MSERELAIPSKTASTEPTPEPVEETVTPQAEQEQPKEEEKLTKEESERIEKYFFEDDEPVKLRDGRTYRIPPLGLRDGKELMKKLNGIDSTVIIANLIENENGEDKYEMLLDILLMAFKPYYPEITKEYLADYVDINIAKIIIDIMIGLNGLKKSL